MSNAWLKRRCLTQAPLQRNGRRSRLIAATLLEYAQIGSDCGIFRRQRFEIADFHVCRFDTWPFRARTEEPATASGHARSVKRIAGNQKLDALTTAKVRADYDAFARAIDVQHQYLDRIAQVIVVKLVVSNAMQAHRCIRRNHEVKCRASWPSVRERWQQTAGRNLSLGDKGNSYEPAHR